MGTFLTQLWTDPTAFATALRTLWSVAWGLVAAGYIPLPGITPEHAQQMALVLMGTAVAIPAGQKNPT